MPEESTIGRTLKVVAPALSRAAPHAAAWTLAKLFTLPMPLPASERQRQWMNSATRHVLQLGKRRVVAYSYGSGPTIALIHGWSGRASQFRLYTEPFVARGYRVVAFDAPAHGESDGRILALPEFASAIQLVAAHLGPFEGIVAHSLGTAAASLALARGLQVGRAVYIAPPEDLPGYLTRLADQIGFTENVAHRAQRQLEERYGVPFAQARGLALAPSMSTELLVFHDEGDEDVPIAEGRRLVQAWPRARIVETKGKGHHRILRDPEVLNEAVAFLSSHACAQRDAG